MIYTSLFYLSEYKFPCYIVYTIRWKHSISLMFLTWNTSGVIWVAQLNFDADYCNLQLFIS